MHAASVHPEPGSNSRNHCIKTQVSPRFNLTSSIALSFFYFCWVVFSSVRISEIRFKLVRFVLLSCCSIFKDQFAVALASTFLLYHFVIRLSIPFWKVFSSFFNFFNSKRLVLQRPLRGPLLRFRVSLHILSLSALFVKSFFSFFSLFLHFW